MVLDVYGAREDPEPGVTGALVAGAVPLPAERVHYVPRWAEVPAVLAGLARPGDLVLTMGAGDVTVLGPEVLRELERAARPRSRTRDRAARRGGRRVRPPRPGTRRRRGSGWDRARPGRRRAGEAWRGADRDRRAGPDPRAAEPGVAPRRGDGRPVRPAAVPVPRSAGAAPGPLRRAAPACRARRVAARYRRRRLAAALFGVVVLLAVVGLGTRVLLYDAGLANVEDVTVTGLTTVPEQAVRDAAAVTPGGPLISVDTAGIAPRVAALEGVASVEVRRAWPHTVEVEVTERVPVALWQTPAGCTRSTPPGCRTGARPTRRPRCPG